MAMQLKMVDGVPVVQEGKPVYVYDDGKEVVIDAEQLFGKISELNNEAKGHRLKAKELEEKLVKLGDVSPEQLMATISEIESLGGLEAIRKGVKVNVDEIKGEMNKAFEQKLQEKEKLLQEKDGHIYKLEVSNRFKASPYINEKLILPPDIAEATFGQNFKIEDGRVVAYLNGNRIFSRERAGELADFEEAIGVIVDAYSMKDRILKGTGNSGGGASSSTGKGTGSVRSRADLKTDADKARFIKENGLDAFKQLPA